MPNESSRKKIIENFAGDRGLIITAYETFEPMILDYLQAIQTAIHEKSSKKLTFAVHTFKGAASNFQPQKVMSILKELMKASSLSNFEMAKAYLLALEAELPHFQNRMQSWITELNKQMNESISLPTGGKILVIDDDEFVANLTAAKLRSTGFKTHVVLDAQNIESHIKAENYDLVILDLFLKDTSGLDVLKKLRESFSPFQLPIMILTSSDSSSDIVECLKAGANDYVTKPIVLEVTAARIKTQLMIKELYLRTLAAKETESVNKMIVTYNHEINNPLSIALGFIGRIKKNDPSSNAQKAEDALIRIKEIVSKISEIKSSTETINYLHDSKMYKVR